MDETTSQGYDNPISLRKEDRLNQWSFAREIFTIADTAPSSWSVRIGIYGDWGTGKTSVLKFIESMAREKNHIVVKFNTWSYRTTDEIWGELTKEVYQSLKIAGSEMKDHKKMMFTSNINKTLGSVSANIKVLDEFANRLPGSFGIKGLTETTKLSLSLLHTFLKANSQQLQKVSEALGERRIIVLIDDLDRTDLHLLPEVLYALREVLDIPGFVFIMGFDPAILGEALKVKHPGWGDGKQFLEKTIDFPRSLPSPTRRQLLKLAKSEINLHGAFIDIDALENIFDFLPKNFRQLHSFLRSLWGIKLQIMRYNFKEISWETLLLINLLKFKQPELTYYLFEKDEEFFVKWGVSKFTGTNTEQATNRQQEVKKLFNQICNDIDLADEQEKQKCFNIIDAIITKNIIGIDVVAMKQIALFTEAPPIFTFKELEIAIEVWTDNKSSDKIKEFITKHTANIESTYDLVFVDLFEKLAIYYEKKLFDSKNDLSDDKCKTYINQAEDAYNLLCTLSFDLNGFTGKNPYLSANHYSIILGITKASIYINNTPEYRNLRKLECSFLEKITTETTLDSILIIEAISPWDTDIEDISYRDTSLYSQLKKDLGYIIEPKASEELLRYLKIEDLSKKPKILVYLILRHQSALWKSNELQQDILNIALNADESFLIQKNLLKLFELFVEELGEKSFQITKISDDMAFCLELIHNTYVIDELWKGALATALNFSVINHYERIRKVIQQYIDVKLTVPDTWEQHYPY